MMKILLRWFLRPLMTVQYHFSRLFGTGPFGRNAPVFLTDRTEMKKKASENGNFLKEGLVRHYIKQFHESSCSVASVTCVINTLLERDGRLPDPVLTQHDLLDSVRAAHWKERMGPYGYNGRRGLPLPVLGEVAKASLDVYQIPYRDFQVIQTPTERVASKPVRQQLKSRLIRFETQGDCLLIAHFDQGSFLPEYHIPHISPVGGFDPVNNLVTVLDVDSEVDHPYKVPFEQFYQGLSHDYNFFFRKYGYGEGGYIFIQL